MRDGEREEGGFGAGGLGRMVMMGGVSVLPSRMSWRASRMMRRRGGDDVSDSFGPEP